MSKQKLTRSYLHVPGKLPFIGRTIGQQLYVMEDKYKNKEMYVFYAENERLSYSEMKQRSQTFAASLLLKGLGKGDRVAILGGNHSEWIVTLLACGQLGIILIKLRLEFPLPVIKSTLEKLGCKALVLNRSPANLIDQVSEIIPTLKTDDKTNFKCSGLPDLEFVVIGNNESKVSGAYIISEFLQIGTESARKRVEEICWTIDIDDPCATYFTSGTTGVPKAALHNHHTVLNLVYGASSYRSDVNGFDPQWENTRFAATMTFAGSASYISACLPLVRPSTTVVLYPVFDVHTMAKALQDEKVTDGLFFIHHISDLVNLPDEETCNIQLRSACLSGSVVPAVLRQKVTKLTKYVTSCYGMTEILGTCFSHPLDPPHVVENAAVFPIGGIEVKLLDENGGIVPVNTMGELHFRGFPVFIRYWGNDEMTKKTKLTGGWMRSGDLAKMDENGYIRILGRIKDIIIKEACNLAPAELEGELYKHHDISKALVTGVPDPRTGEEVCACIIKRQGSSVTAEEIKEFCNGKVYALLVPKYVLFVDDLPTTETGKFSRTKMSEIAQKKLNLKVDE